MNCPSARSSRAKPFFQNNKPRAGKFGRNLEIHLAERFAEIEMLLRFERIVAFRPKMMTLDVVVRILAVRNVVERQIGDFRKRAFSSSLASFSSASIAGIDSLSVATSPSRLLAFFRPCSFWLRRFLSTPRCGAPARFRARGFSAAAFRRARSAAALRPKARARLSARSKASGFSRMKRMSCMQ